MLSDFVGLRVIWPPDGTRPRKHDHDVIFVHGLHHGSISDWQNEDGVCWPAESLSLDLGRARILAFGYDTKKLNIRSDGFYEGGRIFKQGEDLWSALTMTRKSDKVDVPITFVGHGTGGIVVKSALCISHSKRAQFDTLLRKTRHIILLSTPQKDLTWQLWQQITHGTSNAASRGQWKIWSTAHESSAKAFTKIGPYINVTYASAEYEDYSGDPEPDFMQTRKTAHHISVKFEGVNHVTISKPARKDNTYKKLLTCIRENRSSVMIEPDEVSYIRSWLGRRLDDVNADSHQRNLSRHHPGTGEWLFEDTKFRDWVSPDKSDPVLWLVGPGGCGKSILCSVVAEKMRLNVQQQAVVYLMIAFDKPRSQYYLAAQIALQLLDYVVEHRDGVDAETLLVLPKEYDDDKKTNYVYELIKVLVSQCPSVYVFVDGLDEVSVIDEAEQRSHTEINPESLKKQLYFALSFLAGLTSKNEGTQVRLWCSSKQTSAIDEFMRKLEAVELPVSRNAAAADITRYLEHRLENITSNSASASHNAGILADILKMAKNNFLLASAMVDIMAQPNISVESASKMYMHNTPKDISELYHRELDQILCSGNSATPLLQDKSSRALQTISLVTYAKRPLKLSEVQEALAMSQVSFRDVSFLSLTSESNEELDGDIMQRTCAPFISFHAIKQGSKSGYLRLRHSSAFAFLRGLARQPVYATDEARISPNFIAEACLKYLSQKRYDDPTSSYVRTLHFYTYAAKYWHGHIDEADTDPSLMQAASYFIKSPQFLTLTRIQSFLLDRHFANNLVESTGSDDEERPQPSLLIIPRCLGTEAGMQELIDDYQKFMREWIFHIQLGFQARESSGIIEQFFWGALGKQSILQAQGSKIETHKSFLLESDTTSRATDGNKATLPWSYLHETVNEDGTRMAVWKMSALSDMDITSPQGQSTLVRESWYIDGNKPPFQYGLEEYLSFDTGECRWNFYGSSSRFKVPLITNSDTLPQVSPVEECRYGAAVRVGSRFFYRAKGGVWEVDHTESRIDAPYWDSTVVCGPWIVKSHRKQGFEHVPESDHILGIERGNDPLIPLPTPKVCDVPDQEEQSSSEKELADDEESDFMTQSGHSSGARSYSDSEASENDANSIFGESLSSAEEYCIDSSSVFDQNYSSSDGESWTSQRENDAPESGKESEADSTDGYSDTTSSTSRSSVKRKRKPLILATKTTRSTSSAGDSDADDDNYDADDHDSVSTGRKTSRAQHKRGPKHSFTMGLHCDFCSTRIVRFGDISGGRKQDTFYQCSICTVDDTYDICSVCFEKGLWCKSREHLLSKCTFTIRTRRYSWEDGISQQTATPLVKILAGYEEKDPDKESGQCVTPSFRYTRRHGSLLHDSQPIVHPNIPLIVYPLDGRKFLFGDLSKNTHFTYDVPFQASETAETSGSMCIPVSVDLRFSPCGNYFYVMRFTVRNDSATSPIALHVVILTVALCPKDACSGRPTTLPFQQNIDLGVWPRLIPRLPYTVTWTDPYVYLAISSSSLHVLRIPLDAEKLTTIGKEDTASDVCVFSQQVALPQSALSRSVRFFPARDNFPAKVILGAQPGDESQPPIVVYLKAEQLVQWVPTEHGTRFTQTSTRICDEALIEEPYVYDDEELVPKATKSGGMPTLEPIMPIRDQVRSGFQTRGIYCPSCFELGMKLNFLRPHSKIQLHHLNFLPTEEFAYKLEWRVSIPALVEALQAGCQFCCYVACRMLRFHNIRQTSQSIGPGGVRCCAQGSTTEDPEAVQEVIDNIYKFDWKVPPEKQMMVFHCVPLNVNTETRCFDKIAFTLPGLQVGGEFNNHKFAPTMVTVQGENEFGETRTFTTFIHHSKISGQGIPECVLELYSLPDDAAHHLIPTRPLSTSRGKDRNLGVIKSWLKDCQSNHPFCQQRDNTNVQLPTRLVEIVDAKTARLVETTGQFGQYVALSYCWGQNPDDNCMTIMSNFRSRLLPEGLPRDQLPGTIRDAVAVTERLGIKYIWIDALCMLQDNLDDKHEELGKMSQYYRNSFLTIAASTPSCTTGFVGTMGRCEKHPESSLPRDLVPLDMFAHIPDSDKGVSGKIYVREENPYQLHEEPINKRAWTLQECILAPRVLLFGSRVIWFCQHMTHSDGGVEDWSFDQNELERTRREFQVELVKLDREGLDVEVDHGSTDENRDIYDLWHRLIGTYSRRALTWPSDKLPAISAVAVEFSKITKDEYLAGLWRLNLPRDLLWTTPQAATHRPKTWRAPTWSWASVDDAIIYNLPPPKNATLLAEIVEAEVVPLTSMAAFGEVQQGSLVLTAPSFTIRLSDEEKRDEFSKPWLKDFQFKYSKTEREMLHESLRKSFKPNAKNAEGDEKDFRLPDEIFVVCIYGQRDESFRSNDNDVDLEEKAEEWNTWGLVLKKATDEPGEQRFERVLSYSRIRVSTDDTLVSRKETFRII